MTNILDRISDRLAWLDRPMVLALTVVLAVSMLVFQAVLLTIDLVLGRGDPFVIGVASVGIYVALTVLSTTLGAFVRVAQGGAAKRDNADPRKDRGSD